MILVTGGTGLIGSHLLWELVQKKNKVKAIYRNKARLKEVLKIFSYYCEEPQMYFEYIDWVPADLHNIPDLNEAFKQVDLVYHCAGLISFDPNDIDKLDKANRTGTENIVNLCIAHNVKKLCHLSSIASLGRVPEGVMVDERTDWIDHNSNVYALSKYQAEMEVWRGSQEGLCVSILNPGVVLGPGFWNNGSGLFFKKAAKEPKYYPPGGTGFVSVKDLTNIMVMLMNSDLNNERYIVVSENLSYKDVLDMITEGLQVKPPEKELKNWQLQLLWRLDWIRCLFSSSKRKLTKNSVYGLNHPQQYSNDKLRSSLVYSFQPVKEAILKSCSIYKREMT